MRRNPEYMRLGKRKLADGSPRYVKESPKVELILPDGSTYRGKKRETDQKIVEIMGMDADQFTQIAMIAQGDFLKLLHAESKERKRIFSRIFRTRLYYQVQEELKRRAGILYGQLEDNLKAARQEMERVEFAAPFDTSSVSVHGRSALLEWKKLKDYALIPYEDAIGTLQEILDAGSILEKEKKKTVETIQKSLDELNGRKKEGETLNRLFDAFAQIESREEELARMQEECKKWEERLWTAQKAEKVQIQEGRFIRSREAADKTRKEIEEAIRGLEILRIRVREEKERKLRQEEELTKQEKSCNAELVRIEDALPLYE
ncbi:MAG: SMC family ATPase, partial [Lachnospiraceae bacterium]|nr:SMC family ATPase [Lachnospiraceae bacterium]